MRKSHKEKIRIARSLITQNEMSNGVSIFDSEGWIKRKKEIAGRIKRMQGKEISIIKKLPKEDFELKPIEIKVVKLTLWQRIKNWFKGL